MDENLTRSICSSRDVYAKEKDWVTLENEQDSNLVTQKIKDRDFIDWKIL